MTLFMTRQTSVITLILQWKSTHQDGSDEKNSNQMRNLTNLRGNVDECHHRMSVSKHVLVDRVHDKE